MALMNADAIRIAIAEVLEGTYTAGHRDITVGLLSGDLAPGASDAVAQQRAIVVPRFVVTLGFVPLDDPPAQPSSLWLERLNVTIRTYYQMNTQALHGEDYDGVKNDSDTTGQAIRIALCEPGCLTQTAAAQTTGIRSGVLIWTGSEVEQEEPARPDVPGSGLYVTAHKFYGFVQTVAAT